MAKTMKSPASAPLVIQSLRPVSFHPPLVSTARVCSANASEPLDASESAYAPIVSVQSRGNQRAFCSSRGGGAQRVRDERVLHVHQDRRRRVHPAHLLHGERHHHHGAAGAAVRLRRLDPHQSHLEAGLDERGVELGVAFHLRDARLHLAGGERGDGLAERLLLVREDGEGPDGEER